MQIQKLTKTQIEILEQLRLLAMDHAVITENMDTLEPVTTMQEFDIEGDNLKDQLNRKSKIRFFSFRFYNYEEYIRISRHFSVFLHQFFEANITTLMLPSPLLSLIT